MLPDPSSPSHWLASLSVAHQTARCALPTPALPQGLCTCGGRFPPAISSSPSSPPPRSQPSSVLSESIPSTGKPSPTTRLLPWPGCLILGFPRAGSSIRRFWVNVGAGDRLVFPAPKLASPSPADQTGSRRTRVPSSQPTWDAGISTWAPKQPWPQQQIQRAGSPASVCSRCRHITGPKPNSGTPFTPGQAEPHSALTSNRSQASAPSDRQSHRW